MLLSLRAVAAAASSESPINDLSMDELKLLLRRHFQFSTCSHPQ
jgi:hypothetical protein